MLFLGFNPKKLFNSVAIIWSSFLYPERDRSDTETEISFSFTEGSSRWVLRKVVELHNVAAFFIGASVVETFWTLLQK